MSHKDDRVIILEVGDGPEGITIYSSESEGMVDWSSTFPAVYLTAALNGAMVKLGPFSMPAIYLQLKSLLKRS